MQIQLETIEPGRPPWGAKLLGAVTRRVPYTTSGDPIVLFWKEKEMPRIKRWFPVSQDINADPEIWAMCREIGEKAFRVWIEFLSIADRNEGQLPGDLEEFIRLVAGRCQATKRTVRGVYQFAISRLWLASQPTLRVVKYAKYHITRETISIPSEPSEPNRPNHKPPKSPLKGDVIDFAFQRFWDAYPKKHAKKTARKAWEKEARYLVNIQDKIMAALEKQKKQSQWLKDDGHFIPLPATWLNGRRWEDEITEDDDIFSRPSRTPEEILAEKERERRHKRNAN